MLDTTPITTEIARLISTGTTEQQLLAAVARRFPDLTRREFYVALAGLVVGNPFGKVPFSGGGLTFTIPDTPTPVAAQANTCNIVVTSTAQTGQIMGLMSHPLSKPVWQTRDAATPAGVVQ